jgi:monoamine oxidase
LELTLRRFSRRDLIATFLGAPIALAACRRERSPRIPPGTFAGASPQIGHQLRELPDGSLQPQKWQELDVVIVGGGVSGLAAGWMLRRAGIDNFALLELEAAPGGTSRSGQSRVSAYPWGAHYVPVPAPENRLLLSLLEEMRVVEGYAADGRPIVGEQHLCRDPEERIFYRGRWYEGLYLHAGASVEDEAQLARFHRVIDDIAATRDAKGRRAFAIPISASSDDAEFLALDSFTMGEWMRQHRFTSPRLRWLVDYSCRDDYGTTIDETSAWAGVFYFASRVYSRGADEAQLMTWPEGNGRFVSHFRSAIASHVRTSELAIRLTPTKSGVDVVTLTNGRDVRGYRAKKVVFAAPAFLASFVIPSLRDDTPGRAINLEYAPWVVANLELRGRPVSHGFPLSWDNVIYDSPSLGYVAATHQSGIEHGPTVFTWYHALTGDAKKQRQHLLGASREEWADVVLADLERAHPEARTLTTRLDICRWGHAMVKPVPGLRQHLPKLAAPYRNIHFAHTDLSGLALFEEAFDHGCRAANEVATSLRSA